MVIGTKNFFEIFHENNKLKTTVLSIDPTEQTMHRKFHMKESISFQPYVKQEDETKKFIISMKYEMPVNIDQTVLMSRYAPEQGLIIFSAFLRTPTSMKLRIVENTKISQSTQQVTINGDKAES